MGFGFLFVGYLLTFNFVGYNAYSDVFATALMLLGLSTLSAYGKYFRRAFFTGLPLLAIHIATFALAILGLLDLVTPSASLSLWLSVMGLLLRGLFICFTLKGVADISLETDIPVLRLRALRNLILYLPFVVLGMLLETNTFASLTSFLRVLLMFYMLYGLLVTFLNAKTFYEAYIWICLEGEESMERKSSRFGFINRLNALSDRMEERTLSRRAEDKQRREENKRKRKDKK